MPAPYMKHLATGIVYAYQPHWASSGEFEEVLDPEGTPVPPEAPEVVEAAKPAKAAGKAAKAAAEAAKAVEADNALSADASRGTP